MNATRPAHTLLRRTLLTGSRVTVSLDLTQEEFDRIAATLKEFI